MATVGHLYPVVDLFAGPGGLGEGFASLIGEKGKRRFDSVVAIERDEFSHQTLLLRHFLRRFPSDAFPSCKLFGPNHSMGPLSRTKARRYRSNLLRKLTDPAKTPHLFAVPDIRNPGHTIVKTNENPKSP